MLKIKAQTRTRKCTSRAIIKCEERRSSVKSRYLDIEDLVVVRDSVTPETRVACADGNFTRTSELKSTDIVGGGGVPISISSNVGVAGAEEGAVASLNLLRELCLSRSGVGDSAKLHQQI